MRFVFLFSVVVLVCSSQSFADRGFVVGNAGDGYWVGPQVYLTDLLEAGLEKSEINSNLPQGGRIQKILSKLQTSLPIEQESLVQKLTQIDREIPGFGELLARGLVAYEVVAVRVPLDKHPDRGGRLVSLPESSRVQLALRYGYQVRIDLNLWAKMNATNKIALLIHEVFSAILINEVDPTDTDLDHKLMIKEIAIRELTGLVMKSQINRMKFEKLFQLHVKEYLDLRANELDKNGDPKIVLKLQIIEPDLKQFSFQDVQILANKGKIDYKNEIYLICQALKPGSGFRFFSSNSLPLVPNLENLTENFGESLYLKLTYPLELANIDRYDFFNSYQECQSQADFLVESRISSYWNLN